MLHSNVGPVYLIVVIVHDIIVSLRPRELLVGHRYLTAWRITRDREMEGIRQRIVILSVGMPFTPVFGLIGVEAAVAITPCNARDRKYAEVVYPSGARCSVNFHFHPTSHTPSAPFPPHEASDLTTLVTTKSRLAESGNIFASHHGKG